MTFGVLQYIFTKNSLGNAGKRLTCRIKEDINKYLSFFKYASAILILFLVTGFLGIWSVDANF